MIAVGLIVFCMLPMALNLFLTLRFRYWVSFCPYMEGRKNLSYCFDPLKSPFWSLFIVDLELKY